MRDPAEQYPEDTERRKRQREGGCDCLNIVREKLTKRHGSEVELELKLTVNLETGDTGAALAPLYYSYMVGKKRKRSYITFNFCPFCGKPA
jgi:hypothetical protein